jgi:pimeloyl-ACP methyl ester carboxylesterase
MKTSSLAVAAFASLVSALPDAGEHFNNLARRNSSLNWTPCYDNKYIECATFEVPLDYKNAEAGEAQLAVIRYLATKTPRLGSIFTNPGGPGGSGVGSISGGTGEYISKVTGGQYDIVSWDPRGVNGSTPRIDCFETAAEERAFWEGTIPDAGLEARGNFTDQKDLDYFYSQVDEVDTKLQELDAKCVSMSGDSLKYVGSVAAVKDMIAMSDVIEGAGKTLNYWGFSYGTIIGSYFVNMYPARVGRVIIDGVVNPEVWAQYPAHLLWGDSITSTDEALEGFALACSTSGAAGCKLAVNGATPPDILLWIRNLLDKAYDYHVKGLTGGYKSSIIRGYIMSSMYNPSSWVELAETLWEVDGEITAQLAGGNSTSTKAKMLKKRYEDMQLARGVLKKRQDGTAPDYSFQAITCADSIDNNDNVTTKQVFDELVRVTREVSQFFGPSWGDAGFYCHRWTSRATERYQGPWKHDLANNILVIGNEADPITPYASAKWVADTLGDENAVLVEQDDYGHCSLALHSTCTLDIVKNYYTTNTLPTSDQFCSTDQVLFPGPGVTKSSVKSANQANSNSTTSGSSSDNAEIKSLKDQRRTLFYVIGALGLSLIILFFGFLVSWARARRAKAAYARVDHHVAPGHGKGDDPAWYGGHKEGGSHEGGMGYSDPFDPHKSTASLTKSHH